ncbi:MAG: hypothetical protein HQL50_01585 [Magnetococcales bacterium]|nr:hypothetical protein [Magnetococcales bacterium]
MSVLAFASDDLGFVGTSKNISNMIFGTPDYLRSMKAEINHTKAETNSEKTGSISRFSRSFRGRKKPIARQQRSELQQMVAKLYGADLVPSIYIRALARDLRTTESRVKEWWSSKQAIPAQTKVELALLQARRGRL